MAAELDALHLLPWDAVPDIAAKVLPERLQLACVLCLGGHTGLQSRADFAGKHASLTSAALPHHIVSCQSSPVPNFVLESPHDL